MSVFIDPTDSRVVRHKNTLNVFHKGVHHEINLAMPKFLSAGSAGRKGGLTSPMPGKIVKLFVQPGEEVKKGQPLIVMEAMKMEVRLRHTRPTADRASLPHAHAHAHLYV
jgi:acetyl/propionyl-CoA carboxylase alpha subunit